MARKAPKREAVIEFIRSKGPDGAMFSEIQRFIVESNGLNYDSYQPVYRNGQWQETEQGLRTWRGYWCDYFYGPRGMFRKYCKRHPRGRYVRYTLKDGV